MEGENLQQNRSPSWPPRSTYKSLPLSSPRSSPPPPPPENGRHGEASPAAKAAATTTQRKPGGWRAMPYVLGNETFERLASVGLLANFSIFLLTVYHLDLVEAANMMGIWTGVTSFIPLLGAFISDSYLGRFWTIAVSSIFEILGMLIFTIIALVPSLRPPACNTTQPQGCKGPTNSQMGYLFLALGFLAIGSGGIRPCSIPFGVDQFDATTEEGRKGITSFFNWYYTSLMVVLIFSMTVVVYIQDSVSWALGFGIPTGLMLLSIVLFFLGRRVYVYVKPQGSVFSGVAQVFVAAFNKRKVKLPDDTSSYYDPPVTSLAGKKLPLTKDCRFLNKAAVITEGDLKADGTPDSNWNLVSIHQMEEVKCLVRIIPIWAAGIVCLIAVTQQGTFTVSQALKMDRHLGPNFQIPSGSLFVISMITIALWIPVYDRLLVPLIRKRTKIEGGITMLQRIGIGLVFSIIGMIVSALVERKRRAAAVSHGGADGVAPITVMWLAPQLIVMGFAEAFNIIGQIEFFNKEFPDSMTSVANSLYSITSAGASYLSVVLVNVVHKTTAHGGRPDWLTKNVNAGKLENYYLVIAGLGVVNLGYFVYVSRGYHYKSRVRIEEDDNQKPFINDIELNRNVNSKE
ncbi:PREDICTED: protein NRT1/ PTR FAMILY 2.13-like [Ipomoea nil]|uniref:protein NRT1/ PTR FAMILY 2.13-like n=1 Tax=Ipomoea nil TaxID=35883 RepID=UPI000900EE40|nr:PREDICTED: protein NRT1/ PTR FAMILY 2.13-like [Ipomoea nil]